MARWGKLHDLGRYATSGADSDRGAKTPTPREVVTAPYMRDGSLATLEAVIDLYALAETTTPTATRGSSRWISRHTTRRRSWRSFDP